MTLLLMFNLSTFCHMPLQYEKYLSFDLFTSFRALWVLFWR
ncbi:hypothetical protein PESP_b0824 [Pseudoalteromonas espejiana DSM 9414]|nr:hypothetical protein PESP_b0824 [Pseudoalteromonas espejiana DSM 9414]